MTTGIENNSTQDLDSADVPVNGYSDDQAASGTSIDLKFSEALAAITDADAERNQFTLKVNGVSKTVTGISRALRCDVDGWNRRQDW